MVQPGSAINFIINFPFLFYPNQLSNENIKPLNIKKSWNFNNSLQFVLNMFFDVKRALRFFYKFCILILVHYLHYSTERYFFPLFKFLKLILLAITSKFLYLSLSLFLKLWNHLFAFRCLYFLFPFSLYIFSETYNFLFYFSTDTIR